MYGYIYKTTNLINGKIYVGQHKWLKEELDPNYLGSGVLLLKAIAAYGKENFLCEILEFVETKKQSDEQEIYWIEKLNARDNTVGYNIAVGGGDCSVLNLKAAAWRKDHPGYATKERQKYYGKKRPAEQIQHMKERFKVLKPFNNGVVTKYFDITQPIPDEWVPGQLKFSAETYSKRSEKSKITRAQKHWYTNGVDDIWCKDDAVPEGYYRGKTKIVNKNKGLVAINNGEHQKYISEEAELPEGWQFGGIPRNPNISRDKFAAAKGKIWINDGKTIEKYIRKNAEIPEGWEKGRLKNKNKK